MQPRPFVDGEHTDARIVDVDRAERGEADLDPRIKIERHAERKQQCRADHIAVADDQHRPVAMGLVQRQQRLDDPFLNLAHALAAGRHEFSAGSEYAKISNLG